MTMALELDKQREEGKAEGWAEGLAQGKREMLALLNGMVRDGILTIKEAAGRAGLSEESFRKQAMV